ncbi:MAG: hypothetical protein ACRDRO_16450, partial [Pseudonocardiaceae bacterium]
MIGDAPPADDKPDDDTPPPPELGDAGKRALDAMKAKWKAERDRAKALETERDQLRQSTITDEAARKAEADRQAAV